MSLAFNRTLEAVWGVPARLSRRVERVLAPNPGPFTFKGTGVYIVGAGDEAAVIDPGPAIAGHVEALKRAIGTRRLTHILVTHTHWDHSPTAAPLKAWSGAATYGAAPHSSSPRASGSPGAQAADLDFTPDVALCDGAIVAGRGFTFECVATPGHTANHVCYALREESALFSGDHVMGWSTSLVAPPDGDMADYLASLEKLRTRRDRIFYPTHGSPITEPQAYLRELILHRRAREAQIAAAVARGDATVAALAARLYPGIDAALAGAAAAQIQAHLDHLVMQGKIARDGLSYRPCP
jgi:glyoxylase-like metal-dependent hydrolase (beta-lactamase superfamily II)